MLSFQSNILCPTGDPSLQILLILRFLSVEIVSSGRLNRYAHLPFDISIEIDKMQQSAVCGLSTIVENGATTLHNYGSICLLPLMSLVVCNFYPRLPGGRLSITQVDQIYCPGLDATTAADRRHNLQSVCWPNKQNGSENHKHLASTFK